MHLSTETVSHLSQGLNKSYTVSPLQCYNFHFHCISTATASINIKLFSIPLQSSLCSPRKQCKLFFRNTHFLHWKKFSVPIY